MATGVNELAHYGADDHVRAGVIGLAFAPVAVIWAWINRPWFASAYKGPDAYPPW
jgi:hypothetical protein